MRGQLKKTRGSTNLQHRVPVAVGNSVCCWEGKKLISFSPFQLTDGDGVEPRLHALLRLTEHRLTGEEEQ